MTYSCLKLGQHLENRAANPHQEFPPGDFSSLLSCLIDPWPISAFPILGRCLEALACPKVYFLFKVRRARMIKKIKNPGGFIDRQRKRVVSGEEENRGARFSPCAHASAPADVSKRMKRKIKPCLCTGRERPKPMEWNRLNFPLHFKPITASRKLKY